ncbi:MAG: thioesterase-like protein [Alphaproteobacteria bacterium]|nr:thioesterase-like protein [Alphaproteobacteria bacterium]
MTIPAPFDRWRETVRPEWTDYNAHMNLAYYVLIFDHATDAFYVEVGLGEGYRNRTNCSTFAVESHITYDREVMSGEGVRVETLLLDFDEKRLHYFHRMVHAEKGYLAATTELMAVHVDLATRRVSPMPALVLDHLAAMKAAHAALPRSEQVGRVIGIRRRA